MPGGVAPFGPLGRLLQAAPPIPNNTRSAKDTAHRGLRLYILAALAIVKPKRSKPRPPPNPPRDGPRVGSDAELVPVQNVFTTNATWVGPFDVKFTEAGSGTQVMEGAGWPSAPVTEHPNVTVPVNSGVAVSTIPTASLPPGGTGGKEPPTGGVTPIVMGEFVNVSSVEPVTSFIVAEIVVLKSGLEPVEARPAASIVAASGFDVAHATVAVMSLVLSSEKVPVAVNCCVELIGTVGFAGVTAID